MTTPVSDTTLVLHSVVPHPSAYLDAVRVNDNYAWALSATPQELSTKVEEVEGAITEIAFRTAFIQSMTEEDTFDIRSEGCELKDALAEQLRALTVLGDTASALPVIGVSFKFMTQEVDGLLSALETGDTPLGVVIQALNYAFSSLNLSIKAIQFLPFP